MSARTRVLVNLSWLVPGVVGGSEDSLTGALRAVRGQPIDDLDLHLAVLRPFLDAHPDLADAYECSVLELDGRDKVRRVLAEQTWSERGAAAVQENLYRLGLVSRDRIGGAICVGTCAVYRRSALDKIGGITLIEHSEDIHTGFDLNKLGYELRYLPIALATGVCPDNMGAFFSQQYRWCQGSIGLLSSRKFWTMKMRPVVRTAFLSGLLYYAHTAVFVVVGPLMPILMLTIDPYMFELERMLWVLPTVLFSTVLFPLWHRVPYRLEAWSVAVLYSWTHLFTFWDVLRRREMGW